MAAKPAAAGADAAAAEPPKSKKMLMIIILVVVLALVGGGAAFFLLKKRPHAEEGAEGAEAAAPAKPVAAPRKPPDPKAPPTFMPIDNMVVNLADPGGGRFVQLGITLKLEDAKTGDEIKLLMPSVRNAILMTVSQRTADELLAFEGKQKLTRAIIREVSGVLGYEVEDEDEEEAESAKPTKKKRRAPAYTPVLAVLFSSFIVQ